MSKTGDRNAPAATQLPSTASFTTLNHAVDLVDALNDPDWPMEFWAALNTPS